MINIEAPNIHKMRAFIDKYNELKNVHGDNFNMADYKKFENELYDTINQINAQIIEHATNGKDSVYCRIQLGKFGCYCELINQLFEYYIDHHYGVEIHISWDYDAIYTFYIKFDKEYKASECKVRWYGKVYNKIYDSLMRMINGKIAEEAKYEYNKEHGIDE